MGRIAPDAVVLIRVFWGAREGQTREEGTYLQKKRRASGAEARRGASYFLPIVTLLAGPLTVINAVPGVPCLTEPRFAFWMAPDPIETLAAVAPFRSATGTPPIMAQELPQKLFEIESRLPPEPPKDRSEPPILASEPPLTLSSEPLKSDSALPLLKLTRLPATFNTLPPETFTSEPMETSIRLAFSATREAAVLVRRLWPPRAIASAALVNWLPFLRWRSGAEASSRAWSRRTTWFVLTVAPSDSNREPPVLSAVVVASMSPVSASSPVPLPARSNIATSVPRACVPPLTETSGSVVEDAKLPPARTVRRLVGTVRLVSVAWRRGPARLAVDP